MTKFFSVSRKGENCNQKGWFKTYNDCIKFQYYIKINFAQAKHDYNLLPAERII